MKKEFTRYFCHDSLVDIILPADMIKEDETKEWLVIGWPGVDGLNSGLKSKGDDRSIFAFYPIDQAYVKVTDSDEELIEKWRSGMLNL